jgi:carbonic anhydrase
MSALGHLLENNRRWAAEIKQREPDFFARLSRQQSPQYLWIGCSDSRVPANQIVGLMPGELFVHRNVANVVHHADLNCLAVLQFAVEVLHVRHVIVCGHYGCGGVLAALRNEKLGLIDNWLRSVQEVYLARRDQVDALPDEPLRHDRLCELNVARQVFNVANTTVVQDAWRRQQPLSVYGWIYSLKDGRLRELVNCLSGPLDVGDGPQPSPPSDRATSGA